MQCLGIMFRQQVNIPSFRTPIILSVFKCVHEQFKGKMQKPAQATNSYTLFGKTNNRLRFLISP